MPIALQQAQKFSSLDLTSIEHLTLADVANFQGLVGADGNPYKHGEAFAKFIVSDPHSSYFGPAITIDEITLNKKLKLLKAQNNSAFTDLQYGQLAIAKMALRELRLGDSFKLASRGGPTLLTTH